MIDRHVKVLHEYGLLKEQGTFADNVKIFVLTERGQALAKLVDDLSKLDPSGVSL